MRLLRTEDLKLVDFAPNQIPEYAILSHTWGEDEVLMEDIQARTFTKKKAYSKVQYACHEALRDRLGYIWIDTCCIDKKSSAELSEAINSMYTWYQMAYICYAYLPDVVGPEVDLAVNNSEFKSSRWFTRGWTLQELLASAHLVFFSRDWTELGRKETMTSLLSNITSISQDVLKGSRPLESASIAQRMSWAAYRETTRPEDLAYCLMGIFSIAMPMLYGEGGERAFLRLQEEIMKQSDDHTIFAWTDPDASPSSRHGLLAKSPSLFARSNAYVPYEVWESRSPFSMTNRGLQIDLRISKAQVVANLLAGSSGHFLASLDCPAPPNYDHSKVLALHLQKISEVDNQYARVQADRLQVQELHSRGALQSILVRQSFSNSVYGGVFLFNEFQLYRGPSKEFYRIPKVLILTAAHVPQTPLPNRHGTWPEPLRTFEVPKGENKTAAVILCERLDGKQLAVLIGSANGSQPGFSAHVLGESISLHPLSLQTSPSTNYEPSGASIELPSHRVQVHMEPRTQGPVRTYFVNVNIKPLNWDEGYRRLSSDKVLYRYVNHESTITYLAEASKEHRTSWGKRFLKWSS